MMDMENSADNDGADAEPDAGADDGMKKLSISLSEYPDLEGIKAGAPVDVRCKGTVGAVDGDTLTLNLDQCDVTTEGQADKALKDQSAQDDQPLGGGADAGAKGFPGGSY